MESSEEIDGDFLRKFGKGAIEGMAAPDIDNLPELIENQVRAHDVDPAQKALAFTYATDDGWFIAIDCRPQTIVARGTGPRTLSLCMVALTSTRIP